MSARAEPFVGRTGELAMLRQVMAEVDAGHPRTVLLTGPAGIGKSSLLEQFFAEASGTTLIGASGEEWEALVAYGVVDQILRMAGRTGYLPTGRNRALPPDEPISAGTLVLETLADLGRDSTVLLVVDDVHWADVDSLRALLFVLRRLVRERVFTLFVARDEDAARLPGGLVRLAGGSTGRSIQLGALGERDIRAMAAARGVPRLSLTTAQRLREHTRGNPLYIGALLSELPADRWQSWEPTLPAPRAFAEQIVGRLAAGSTSTRSLVEACAVLGVRSSLRTAATLADLTEPVGVLEEAVAGGLLRATDNLDPWDVTFPHPLIRAAVYEHVAPARRVHLHRRAAELLDDTGTAGTALRHLVQPPPRLTPSSPTAWTPSPGGR